MGLALAGLAAFVFFLWWVCFRQSLWLCLYTMPMLWSSMAPVILLLEWKHGLVVVPGAFAGAMRLRCVPSSWACPRKRCQTIRRSSSSYSLLRCG